MNSTHSSLDTQQVQKIIAILKTYLWPTGKSALRRRVILALSALVISKLINVATPILFKDAINSLMPAGPLTTWPTITLALVVSYGLARIGAQGFNELKDMIFAHVEQHAIRAIALRVFQHLHNLSLRFHLDRKTGALNRIIDRGVKGIETLLRFMLFNILPICLEVVFVAVVLWSLFGLVYALVTVVTLACYIATTIGITNWRMRFIRHMNQAENESSQKALDSLINYETVKYFTNEAWEADRFDKALASYEQAAIRTKVTLAILNVSQGAAIAIGLIVLLGLAALDVWGHTLTVGDFVLVNTYLIQLYLPLNILGFAYREIKLALVNMEEMFNLLSQPAEILDPSTPKTLVKPKGAVQFQGVDFQYRPDYPILKDVSFEIRPGKTLAIVGGSGAGKSTIARLMLRLYDPARGQILMDGVDIRQLRQQELRHLIGVVPQDTVLFNDTIYYNIAYGDPSADRKAVLKAAQTAQIHDFIISLPEGYETLVGERGLKLSGGEKQRVAMARALLKNPVMYIFDEATSSLDTTTEKQIQESLRELSKNHTTLVIAHRLSTIVEADEIIVLDQGQIAERGTHKKLLAQKGLYAKLWANQSKSFD